MQPFRSGLSPAHIPPIVFSSVPAAEIQNVEVTAVATIPSMILPAMALQTQDAIALSKRQVSLAEVEGSSSSSSSSSTTDHLKFVHDLPWPSAFALSAGDSKSLHSDKNLGPSSIPL